MRAPVEVYLLVLKWQAVTDKMLSPPELSEFFGFGRPHFFSQQQKEQLETVLLRLFELLSNMAPLKRKGAIEEDSSPKKQKRGQVAPDENKRQNKHQYQASGSQGNEATKKPSSSLQKDSAVIRDEEPSFPRGGGSVLTPLERKQIQIQATRDVLFEQKGSAKASGGFDEDDSDVDIDLKDADKETVSTKKPRKSKSKNREDRGTTKEGVRIESLSFKVRL